MFGDLLKDAGFVFWLNDKGGDLYIKKLPDGRIVVAADGLGAVVYDSVDGFNSGFDEGVTIAPWDLSEAAMIERIKSAVF